jgi:teneurin
LPSSAISASPVLFSKLGDTIEDQIMPNELFNLQFYIDSSMFIKFNLSISKNANVGLYADKNAAPSFTRFKFFETFNSNGASSMSKKPAVDSDREAGFSNKMINTAFIYYLEEGLWHLSLYNDNKHPIKFILRAEFHGKLKHTFFII